MRTIKQHPTLFIILGIIVVVIAAMLYVALQPQQAKTPSDGANTNNGTQQTENDTDSAGNGAAEPAIAGRYEDYNETAFSQVEGRRVLFFYAPWCPQCRALDSSIKESAVPTGVTIFKIDYDSNQGLRQKYGVTIQTTLVEVDENGNEVKKYVAYDEPAFDAVKAAMGL